MSGMTKLLEQGIEAVRELPEKRQNEAGELLLTVAAQNGKHSRLTAEQIKDAKKGLAQAERGEFATDEEMAKTWKKFGA